MTTAYDITLEMMRHVGDVLQGGATDGGKTYLKDVRNMTQANEYWNGGTLWVMSGTHAGKMLRVDGHVSQKVTFEPLASALCVQQVETATVAGTISGAGNATVVVTAAAMPNSPKTLSVAVANLDTASQVATKIRTALNADADVKGFFDIGGSGADITLTTKIARGNDATINMSIANGTCTGLTTAATSANTTAGVAGPRYALASGAFPMEQMFGAMNAALAETYVTAEDASLTGDGETLRFTLPAGVEEVKEIWFERPSQNNMRGILTHWEPDHVTGELVFDDGFPPMKDDVLHLFHRTQHEMVTGYDTEISTEINRQWLVFAGARELLFWGRGMYGEKNKYMIDDRLNKVLAMLKGKRARRGLVDINIKTGSGGHRGYSIQS